MKAKTKSMCSGCRDNFYNGGNPYGVAECWSYKDAQVVKRVMIHRDQAPPYRNVKPRETLSCWYGDSGMLAVKPESIGKDGFWKC